MPKIVDRQAKSQDIATAAIKVFRTRGYNQTRMADIARAAGVGKGTLYEYFRDKADILRFAFDDYFQTFTSGAAMAMDQKATAADKLLALADFALDHAAQWEDHCAVYVDYFGAARTDPADQIGLAEIYGQMRQILEHLIREGQADGDVQGDFQPGALAELLISVFDGLILHHIFEGRGLDRETIRRQTMRLLTRGILTAGHEDGAKDHD
ncbi:MAG: TetR/AcrR family transcriptional regulator [Proteobacteria bacterium]|nr:TetR/AcrR family transcriptional regulator [Pseudomonadota bacterium]MBU1742735.1 TetR/AcrR family transcriptional regulator [Pseudomonadota bacterium]